MSAWGGVQPIRPLALFGARRRAGFTLAEMIVSVATSSIILGALILSGVSLRKGLNSTETYTMAYVQQHRISDYLGRDLRRAIAVSSTTDDGATFLVGNAPLTVTIEERATLTLTLPGYYRTDDSRDDAALDVVGDAERLDYGAPGALAAPVTVQFRKIFYAKEGCICFIRQEGSKETVIVRDARDLQVQVRVNPGGQSATIQTWFRSQRLGPAPLVTTSDRLLIRNLPQGFRP